MGLRAGEGAHAMIWVWSILAVALLLYALRGAYVLGWNKNQNLYTSALKRIQDNYESDLLVQAKRNYKDTILFYVCGIVLGFVVAWLVFKKGILR